MMGWLLPQASNPMRVDIKSEGYRDFTGFMFQLLTEASEPLPDDRFWEIVEGLDWPGHTSQQHPVLARELARRCDLEETVAATVTAFDRRWDIEEALAEACGDEIGRLLPSEDGVEDFCFHLVGMGRDFYERLSEDPEPALMIARENRFEPSFRYVFEGAFPHYPYKDYQKLLPSWFQVVTTADIKDPAWGTILDLGDGLLGLIVRPEPGTLHLSTPVGPRTLPWPAP
jgi:hypothetical protein